jgi:heme exporter protein D
VKLDKAVLGIVLLALLPVVPQAVFGYGGHDFHLHVSSWMEVRDLWQAGQFRAGWAPRASFTLGDPHLTYYPPVSFAVGAALAMLLPFKLVPAVFVWLSFALSGLAMYYASKEFVAAEDRWKAAVLYMASPYMFTTVLVRFAAAEALTMTWLPLIFLFFHQSVWQRQRRAAMLLGCFLGLTWITNVPASIVLLYVLLPVVFLLAAWQRSIRPVLVLFLAECLAAALAAFYLAPTWLEQGWIHKDSVLRFPYDVYFLFIPVSRMPQLLYGLALWIFTGVSTALVAIYAWAGRANPEEKNQTRTWLAITMASFFFQLPISAFLWRHLPELSFAGFPYRFLAPIGVMLPLMLLARNTPKSWRKLGYVLIALMALLPIREYRANKTALVDFKSLVNQWQQVGYRGLPEFVPAGATRPMEPVQFAPASVVDAASNPGCTVAVQSLQAEQKVLLTDTPMPCQVKVATYFFPYWHAADESGNVLSTSKDAYGLLLITVPTGKHTVQLTFRAASTARTVSLIVSLICLVCVALALIRGGQLRARIALRPANRPIPAD